MLLRAYSIYDNKALQYHPPFFASADGAAVRSFSDAANDLQTNIGRHPSDFSLFFVGSFDDQHCSLVPELPIVHVVDAKALVKAPATQDFFRSANGHDMSSTNIK